MDQHRFDVVTRRMGGAPSRQSVPCGLFTAGLGWSVAQLPEVAEAKKTRLPSTRGRPVAPPAAPQSAVHAKGELVNHDHHRFAVWARFLMCVPSRRGLARGRAELQIGCSALRRPIGTSATDKDGR